MCPAIDGLMSTANQVCPAIDELLFDRAGAPSQVLEAGLAGAPWHYTLVVCIESSLRTQFSRNIRPGKVWWPA
eukprot:1141656-Pelagomonas_calceolata.AAC.2